MCQKLLVQLFNYFTKTETIFSLVNYKFNRKLTSNLVFSTPPVLPSEQQSYNHRRGSWSHSEPTNDRAPWRTPYPTHTPFPAQFLSFAKESELVDHIVRIRTAGSWVHRGYQLYPDPISLRKPLVRSGGRIHPTAPSTRDGVAVRRWRADPWSWCICAWIAWDHPRPIARIRPRMTSVWEN